MRAVVQRVTEASVTVDGTIVGAIGHGLCVLVGVREGDGLEAAGYLADKVANLRIFNDGDGKMNRSLVDTGGAALVVSQFTLYGDVRRGRRPSFVDAARPDVAEPLVVAVADGVRAAGIEVAQGRFGASMSVALVNDGPVTIVIDSPD